MGESMGFLINETSKVGMEGHFILCIMGATFYRKQVCKKRHSDRQTAFLAHHWNKNHNDQVFVEQHDLKAYQHTRNSEQEEC